MKQNLWLFTFEYMGIKKVGGLGEVPANQAKWLSDRYNITVFIPSHNSHTDEKVIKNTNLVDTGLEYKDTINALKFELGDKEEEINIGFYRGTLNGVKIIVLVGKNKFSSEILNDPVVYSPKTLAGKFILFSKGIKFYIKHVLDKNPEEMPKLVHCHDHHSVPAMINVRQTLNKSKLDVATIITIHLLTWPRKPLDFLWACGVEDETLDLFIENKIQKLNISELYELAKNKGDMDPTLEQIGVLFADIVTSVSENYLNKDIVGRLGTKWIADKSDFFWNGCDWDYENMVKKTQTNWESELKLIDSENPFDRSTLRKYLLTKGFDNLPEREPVNDSAKIREFLAEILTEEPYKADPDGSFKGKVTSFKEDGPLIMMTGRLSTMKGIDTLLDSVPLVLKKHPDAKFILYLIPSEFSMKDIEGLLKTVLKYKDNVRVMFGKMFSLFFPTHISADVYCCPSRWEPFGIIALEAMISRIPVVATKVGGLQESVVDLKKYPQKGTGYLIEVDKSEQLADSLNNLIATLKIDEFNRKNILTEEKYQTLSDMITDDDLKKNILENKSFGSKIRINCGNRVEQVFRWKQVSEKLVRIYNDALIKRD